MPKILIVDKDNQLTTHMKQWLTYDKYFVEVVAGGQDALDRFLQYRYDAVILGRPSDKATVDILTQYRQMARTGPVMVMSGRQSPTYKEYILDTGADDYVRKPCEMIELTARLRALLRRQIVYEHQDLQTGDITANIPSRRAFIGGEEIKLSPLEFKLLVFLMMNPNRVFNTEQFAFDVWNSGEAKPSLDSIRTCVKGLRQKLRQVNAGSSMIRTVRGVGYLLDLKAMQPSSTPPITNPQVNTVLQPYLFTTLSQSIEQRSS